MELLPPEYAALLEGPRLSPPLGDAPPSTPAPSPPCDARGGLRRPAATKGARGPDLAFRSANFVPRRSRITVSVTRGSGSSTAPPGAAEGPCARLHSVRRALRRTRRHVRVTLQRSGAGRLPRFRVRGAALRQDSGLAADLPTTGPSGRSLAIGVGHPSDELRRKLALGLSGRRGGPRLGSPRSKTTGAARAHARRLRDHGRSKWVAVAGERGRLRRGDRRARLERLERPTQRSRRAARLRACSRKRVTD